MRAPAAGGAVTPFLLWFGASKPERLEELVRLMLGADRDLTVIGETPAIGEHPEQPDRVPARLVEHDSPRVPPE